MVIVIVIIIIAIVVVVVVVVVIVIVIIVIKINNSAKCKFNEQAFSNHLTNTVDQCINKWNY